MEQNPKVQKPKSSRFDSLAFDCSHQTLILMVDAIHAYNHITVKPCLPSDHQT